METEMGSETSAAQAMSRVEPPFSPFSWPTQLIILQLPYFFSPSLNSHPSFLCTGLIGLTPQASASQDLIQAISQASRGRQRRKGPRPLLSTLSALRGKSQHADAILLRTIGCHRALLDASHRGYFDFGLLVMTVGLL
jgi:hypothetical protein